jgi:hypothetical protein
MCYGGNPHPLREQVGFARCAIRPTCREISRMDVLTWHRTPGAGRACMMSPAFLVPSAGSGLRERQPIIRGGLAGATVISRGVGYGSKPKRACNGLALQS